LPTSLFGSFFDLFQFHREHTKALLSMVSKSRHYQALIVTFITRAL
jgi:hypothetical protein